MDKTIYKTFRDSVEKNRDRIALMYRKEGKYQGMTYSSLLNSIDSVAASIQKLGVTKGDTVAILSYNRPEWAIADMAVLKLGGIVVPIYHMPGHRLPSANVKYILNDAYVKMIFVENSDLFSVIEQIKDETPSLKNVILFDYPKAGEKDFLKFNDLKKAEHRTTEEIATITGDDIATIVYTSGTTGEPKGVMLSHNNIICNAFSAIKKCHFTSDDVVISYLPLAHILERACGYYTVLFAGGTIGYAEDLTTVARDAEEIHPTVLLVVPRIVEKAFNMAVEKVEGSSPFKRGLVASAIKNLNELANLKYKKKKIPLWLKLKCSIYYKLVASKFRSLGGGRIRLIVSGAAPLNRQIAKILYVFGFNIVEGYGLTETVVVSCNTIEDNRLGTVGKPFDDVEIKIGENDEILVRGPNVMKGYYNKPEETAKAIDKDGWFHTGDQGKFDEYNNLVITGRIKEIIVTSGGKKIAPAPIEAKISISRYIEQVMLYGDKRHYLVALVVPNPQSIEQFAAEKSIPYNTYSTLLTKEEIKELIRHEIENATFDLPSYERIKVFALLEEGFTVENGMLTLSQKLKRKNVVEKYSNLIESMY